MSPSTAPISETDVITRIGVQTVDFVGDDDPTSRSKPTTFVTATSESDSRSRITEPPATEQPKSNNDSNDLGTGAIVGIVIAAVGSLAAVLTLIINWKAFKRQFAKRKSMHEAESVGA